MYTSRDRLPAGADMEPPSFARDTGLRFGRVLHHAVLRPLMMALGAAFCATGSQVRVKGSTRESAFSCAVSAAPANSPQPIHTPGAGRAANRPGVPGFA